MKHFFGLILVWSSATVWAQDTAVYRCGNEYTNAVRDAKDAKARGCKLVEGGNVTIIHSKPSGGSGATSGGGSAPVRAPAPSSPRNDGAEQRARDSDARMILETELKKAEARKSDLAREYNNGEPSKNALEMRNPAFYNKRVEDLKTEITRMDSDIAGIQRELQRLPAP